VAGNAIAIFLLGLRFASIAEAFSTPMVTVYSLLVLFGHMPMLVLPVAAVLALLVRVWPRRCWVTWIAPLLFGLVFGALAVDSIVLAQYRFHLNGMVFDFLFGGAAAEVFNFGPITWSLAIGSLVLLFAGEFLLARIADRFGGVMGCVSWRVVLIVAPAIALVAHLSHGFAQAGYRSDVVRVARFFPLYFPLTVGEWPYRLGLVNKDTSRSSSFSQIPTTRVLVYPRSPLRFRDPKVTPNILLVVVDSWRADALDGVTMPRLAALGGSFDRFELHRSGSNGTRGGIFSLFYGLPSLFWDDTISERRGPVLFEALRRYNYEVGIFSSAPLTSPTFDRNVFVDLPSLRLDTRVDGKRLSGYLADNRAVDEWFGFLDGLKASGSRRPFFGFLFLDAAHSYTYPPEHRVFEPVWEEALFLALNNQSDRTPFFNLYRNALHFVDEKVGSVLEDLRSRGNWDDTIVVLVGDHGQEFNDFRRNYWGHGSNFGKFQLQTPLLVRWPGREPAVHLYETSHYDLVPTILEEAFGVENEPSDYSFGKSLYVSRSTLWLLAGSFDNYGIVEPDRITVKYSTGNYEIYTPSLEPLDVPLRTAVVSEMLRRIGAFYR
jgi:membrane-anchored protein YejM (alkaline phosphatase superfamily)